MADDDKKRFEEYESFRKSRQASEADFIEALQGQLDISKKLNNSYKNIINKLERANELQDKARAMQSRINSEIQKTESQISAIDQIILRNNAELNDIKREMVANDNRLLQIDAARETLEQKRLLAEQELKNSMDRREGLQWAISEKVREETEQRERSLDLSTRITDNNQEQEKIQERINRGFISREDGEKEISRLQQQNVAFAGELLVSQDAMNQAVSEKVSLQDRLNSEIDVYEQTYERLNKIDVSLVELQKEKNQLQERNNSLKAKEQNLNERNSRAEDKRNSLIGQRESLQKSLVEWVSREAKAVEMINKLSAQLVFVKMIQAAYDRFVVLDKAAEDFRRTTGFTVGQMAQIRKYAEEINVQFADMGVSIEQVYKSATALANVFNRTSLISKDAMMNVSLLSQNLGVSEEVSAQVLENFMGIGKSSEAAAFDAIKLGAALSEKTGVPFARIMDDVAKASETTINMIGGSPAKLMKAAIAARALGLDINKIASSQRKMLDFTSSINDELELSALLGKSISFQKARQLAYEGDAVGAAKATLETVKAAGDFEKMNVYQREQLAKAAGMELKDLSKALAVEKQRDAILYGADEEKRKQLLMQEEELKKMQQMSESEEKDLIRQNQKVLAQQKMQGVMTKLKNIMDSLTIAFADILEPVITALSDFVVPLFKVIVGVLKISLIPLLKLMVFPLQAFGSLVSKIGQGFDTLLEKTEPIKTILDAISGWFKSEDSYWTKMIAGGGLLALFLTGKLGFSGFGKALSGAFSLLKPSNIAKGFIAAKDAVGGFFGKLKEGGIKGMLQKPEMIGQKLSTDAAKGVTDTTKGVSEAAKTTQKTPSGTGVKDFLTNLAAGLKEMGNSKVFFGALNLIPASVGLIAMIPGFFGAKLIEKINGKALSEGLTGLASGIEKMGTGRVLLGAAGMLLSAPGLMLIAPAALMASVIGLVGPLIESGLKSVATGIGYMGTPKVFLGAAGIAAVGLSIIPFAYAMKMFGNVDWGAVGLGSLALIGFTAAAFGLGALIASGVGGAIFTAGVIGIAALGAALIPFGVAAIAAGYGIKLLGEGIAGSVDPILRLSEIDLTKTAMGIGAIGVALAAFGAGSAGAGLGSFVGNLLGGDPISKMERLAKVGPNLLMTSSAISMLSSAFEKFNQVEAFAKSVDVLTVSIGKMNEELEKTSLLKLTAIAAMTAASNIAVGAGTTTGRTGEEDGIIEKLDAIHEALVGGKVAVYVDGIKVSKAIAQTS